MLNVASTTQAARQKVEVFAAEQNANGFKNKTLATRLGPITFQIPQTRGIAFYPSALEKGVRSERALKLAIAEIAVLIVDEPISEVVGEVGAKARLFEVHDRVVAILRDTGQWQLRRGRLR